MVLALSGDRAASGRLAGKTAGWSGWAGEAAGSRCPAAPRVPGADWAKRAVVVSGLSEESSAQYCSSETLPHSAADHSGS
jgi:hypothetical protein